MRMYNDGTLGFSFSDAYKSLVDPANLLHSSDTSGGYKKALAAAKAAEAKHLLAMKALAAKQYAALKSRDTKALALVQKQKAALTANLRKAQSAAAVAKRRAAAAARRAASLSSNNVKFMNWLQNNIPGLFHDAMQQTIADLQDQASGGGQASDVYGTPDDGSDQGDYGADDGSDDGSGDDGSGTDVQALIAAAGGGISLDDSALMGGLGDTSTDTGSIFGSILDTVKTLAPAYVSVRGQQQLLNAQLNAAKAGLPPQAINLPGAGNTPVSATARQLKDVGFHTTDWGTYALWGGAALAVGYVGLEVAKHLKSRRRN